MDLSPRAAAFKIFIADYPKSFCGAIHRKKSSVTVETNYTFMIPQKNAERLTMVRKMW
jgi:hypothetical protein